MRLPEVCPRGLPERLFVTQRNWTFMLKRPAAETPLSQAGAVGGASPPRYDTLPPRVGVINASVNCSPHFGAAGLEIEAMPALIRSRDSENNVSKRLISQVSPSDRTL